jgi:hypothetical protein
MRNSVIMGLPIETLVGVVIVPVAISLLLLVWALRCDAFGLPEHYYYCWLPGGLIAIRAWASKKIRSSEDFLVAGRNLGFWLLLFW